ncbi:MAG: hypothetical protein HLX51_10245 [Micrococcaceae bacterium]|nr:hypothetical protein [Micrococcaceae bacterium]
MSIAIWIAIALACFVLPATSLTSGGKRHPEYHNLARHAEHVGLPLPDHIARAVATCIRRRQRGMSIGGSAGIVLATIVFIIFFDNDDGAIGAFVLFCAGAGTVFGGAWAIAAYRPSQTIDRPVVARMRSVGLADYLTKGERFGLWAVPAVLIVGVIVGGLLLGRLPEHAAVGNYGIIAGSLSAVALLTWVAALVALRRVLMAPARTETQLELAWADSERAQGLRQVANLSVIVASMALLFWLVSIGVVLTTDGFYRNHPELTWSITGIALIAYLALCLVAAAGPLSSWLSGRRKGYEQRQLWSDGVPV